MPDNVDAFGTPVEGDGTSPAIESGSDPFSQPPEEGRSDSAEGAGGPPAKKVVADKARELEGSEDGSDETAEEQKEGAEEGQEEQEDEPRFYDYKSGHIQRQVDADIIDEAAHQLGIKPQELLKGVGLTAAALEKTREVAQDKAKIKAFVDAVQTDPYAAVQDMIALAGKRGPQAAENARQALYRAVLEDLTGRNPSEEQMEQLRQIFKGNLTPEQRELERMKAREEEREAAARQEEQRRYTEEVAKPQLFKEYTAAFKELGLARVPPQFIARMAEKQLSYQRHGVEADAVDVAKIVLREHRSQLAAALKDLDPEDLEVIVDPAILKRLRKQDTERLAGKVRSPDRPAPRPQHRPAAQNGASRPRPMTEREFKKAFDADVEELFRAK